MFSNCYLFHEKDTDYYRYAKSLEEFLDRQLEVWIPDLAYDEDIDTGESKKKRYKLKAAFFCIALLCCWHGSGVLTFFVHIRSASPEPGPSSKRMKHEQEEEERNKKKRKKKKKKKRDENFEYDDGDSSMSEGKGWQFVGHFWAHIRT